MIEAIFLKVYYAGNRNGSKEVTATILILNKDMFR